MVNLYQDAKGQYCNRDEMLRDIDKAALSNNRELYLSLRKKFDLADADNVRFMPISRYEELIRSKNISLSYRNMSSSVVSSILEEIVLDKNPSVYQTESILKEKNYDEDCLYVVLRGGSNLETNEKVRIASDSGKLQVWNYLLSDMTDDQAMKLVSDYYDRFKQVYLDLLKMGREKHNYSQYEVTCNLLNVLSAVAPRVDIELFLTVEPEYYMRLPGGKTCNILTNENVTREESLKVLNAVVRAGGNFDSYYQELYKRLRAAHYPIVSNPSIWNIPETLDPLPAGHNKDSISALESIAISTDFFGHNLITDQVLTLKYSEESEYWKLQKAENLPGLDLFNTRKIRSYVNDYLYSHYKAKNAYKLLETFNY